MTRTAAAGGDAVIARFGIKRNLLRPEGSGRSDRVTYIELFFDLIFVFALTQLSDYFYENQTLLGAVEAALLILALWWVWVYTTWVTNWLDPARLPVRGVVIGLAFVCLVMTTSINESFGERGVVFAVAYVALQLGRTAFMVVALARHDSGLHRTFVRVLIWLTIAGVLWILGAIVPIEYRLPVWLAALVIEYVSASFGFRVPGLGRSRIDDWDLSGPHIAERSALFVIIALGELFLVTGFAFVGQELSVAGVLGVLLAFTSAVAMWWLYFDHAERSGSRAIANSTEPGRIARQAYTYVHTIIIGGIVLTSVSDKELLKHPDAAMSWSTAITIVGGPLLFVIGMLLFRWVVARELLIAYLVGIGLLLGAFSISFLVPPLALGAISTGTLVVVASWETIVRVRTGTTDDAAG